MVATLHVMSVKVMGFERIIQNYSTCPEFDKINSSLTKDPPHTIVDFTLVDGFLF